MKKKLLALLLMVPILLIPILSCDGDILGSLSDLMGKMGTNSLIEGGVVVIDTSQGPQAIEKMAGLSELDDDDYKEAVQEVKNVANDALASKGSTKAKAFTEEMQKTLAEGTEVPTPVTTAIGELKNELDIDFEIETEGDLLAAVLLVDLMDKVTELGNMDDATPEELIEFVGEALKVIDIVQTVSPVNGVKIDDIIGELLGGDLSSLFSKGVSRNGDSRGEEIDEILGKLKSFLDPIVKAIGKDGEGKVSQAGLDRMIFNFKVIRKSFEDIAKALETDKIEDLTKVKFTLTDFINYALSVVFTEANSTIKSLTDGKATFAGLINVYIDWADGKNINFEDFGALFDSGEDGEGDTLVKAILDEALKTMNILVPFSEEQWLLDMLTNIGKDGDI